jgi:hypothetical protein
MTTRPRRSRALALFVALGLLVSACAKNEQDSEEVRDFIDDTSTLSHRFVYVETNASGQETAVQGLIEDDFRYKARLLIDGKPIIDRIVSDDTVAVRFLEPSFLARYIDKDAAPLVDAKTQVDGVDVYSALQSKRWVKDPGGAPPQLVAVDNVTDPGVDPIYDALAVLPRLRALTFLTFTRFVLFNPDSIGPTYRTDEDPFPAPERGSGVKRYDLSQPQFPQAQNTANDFLAGESNFRKLAVFVKDGVIIGVSEQVGVTERTLDDFKDYMVALINVSAPKEVRAGFKATADSVEGDKLSRFLLESLNTFRDLQGDPPVRFRFTSYELLDVNASDIVVDLPVDNVIEGNLAVLVNLGVKPLQPDTDDDAATTDDTADADQ